MLCALLGDRVKAGSQLDTFYRIDAHQGMGNIRIQPVKDWLAQSHRHIFGDHGDLGAHRVTLFTQRFHILFQLGNLALVGEEERVLFNLVAVKVFGIDWTQLGDIAKDLYTQLFLKVLFGNTTGGNPHGGFPGRAAPAAAVVPLTVFLVVGVIRMGGPEQVFDIAVVFGFLVLVFNDHTNGCASGSAFKDTGEYFDFIIFTALGGIAGLARLAAVQVRLQVGCTDLQSRGATVDYTANGEAVAFAKTGDGEKFTYSVSGHSALLPLSISRKRSIIRKLVERFPVFDKLIAG